MIVKKTMRKWTKEEKQRIILDIQRLGVVAGCRKYDLANSVYYKWVDRYNASGIDGLDDSKHSDSELKKANAKLIKELALLKEIVAERDMEIRLKDELLKKKHAEWRSAGKS